MKAISLLSKVANTLTGGSPESSEEEAVIVQDCREDLMKAGIKWVPEPDCQLLTG